MTRYQKLFEKIKTCKEGAFVPFVTLGDPDFQLSTKIINILIESGSDALELGIPFSNPLADGPSIQHSFQRALDSKISIDHCFKIISIIRKQNEHIPIGLLTYTNLVFKNKIDTFYERCKQHQIDSILIADLPIEESTPFRNAALCHNISQIFICPPNANNSLLKKIATYSQSYTYLTSRDGVTGHENPFTNTTLINKLIQNLNKYNSPPILQGFGIYSPLQAQAALLSGAVGVIAGSAIADIIKKNINDPKTLFNQLQNFVESIKNSMK